VTEVEQQIFELAMEEQRQEKLADAIAERLLTQKRPGAPRKTKDDVKFLEELMNKHRFDTKHAQKEFLNVVCKRDHIQNKRASERYRSALKELKSRNT